MPAALVSTGPPCLAGSLGLRFLSPSLVAPVGGVVGCFETMPRWVFVGAPVFLDHSATGIDDHVGDDPVDEPPQLQCGLCWGRHAFWRIYVCSFCSSRICRRCAVFYVDDILCKVCAGS